MRRPARRTEEARTHTPQCRAPRHLQPQGLSPHTTSGGTRARTSQPQGTPPSAARVPQALWMAAWGAHPHLPQCCPWTATLTHSLATIRPGSHVYSVVPRVPGRTAFPSNR
uniref:Uncharacterized protein n=1 Tax=Prolemur simus TaxID=1328070 RepID=A0A8C8YS45_PROSS